MLWPWWTIGRMSRHLSPSRRMIATSAGSACGSLTLTVMLSWSSIARRAMGNWLTRVGHGVRPAVAEVVVLGEHRDRARRGVVVGDDAAGGRRAASSSAWRSRAGARPRRAGWRRRWPCSTSVSSSRSRASRAARWLRPPMRWASSSMSSCLMRRCPPAVRVQGRKPDAVQRRMVCGETPRRRAASCTLRYMRKPYPQLARRQLTRSFCASAVRSLPNMRAGGNRRSEGQSSERPGRLMRDGFRAPARAPAGSPRAPAPGRARDGRESRRGPVSLSRRAGLSGGQRGGDGRDEVEQLDLALAGRLAQRHGEREVGAARRGRARRRGWRWAALVRGDVLLGGDLAGAEGAGALAAHAGHARDRPEAPRRRRRPRRPRTSAGGRRRSRPGRAR